MAHDDASVEVVLSEERLRTGTRKVPVERVRIHKRVVTQTRTVTIEERHEELSIERVPLTEGGETLDAADETDDELVLVLHAEVAEVVTRVIPVERVQIRRETVTENVPVQAELRREDVQFDEGKR